MPHNEHFINDKLADIPAHFRLTLRIIVHFSV
jgi:hypothetical protein